MPDFRVGDLLFQFPQTWTAQPLDEWSFYRNQFSRLASATLFCSKCGGTAQCALCKSVRIAGTKGCDIVAIDGNQCCWLIEVKDYRRFPRSKSVPLSDEVALKVRDSLTALAAAQFHAPNREEQSFARAALECRALRIALHLEQPLQHSRLFPRAFDPHKVQLRLRQLVKPIDAHPLVVESADLRRVSWNVERLHS